MISIKPSIYNINAFDAKYDSVIKFTWSGNQPYSNTCTIKNNATNAIVYQKTQETLQLKHTIPANTLTNGTLYNIAIKVTDQSGSVSESSITVLFYCFSSPSLTISNLTENQVIQNSSYNLTLSYSQPEGEELQYYQVLLYNTNKSQIWTSGVKYDSSNLTATLTDLDDNGVYYLRATGITVNGMDLDTGYIYFSVNYIQPSVYALITLENLKEEGSVKIQSNIISLSASYYNGDPTYINDNYINLTGSNNHVYFDKDFSLDNDFSINIKGYGFLDYKKVLQISNGTDTITLEKKKGTFSNGNNKRTIYYELKAPNSLSTYIAQSNLLDITETESTDIFSIWVRRQNGAFDVYAENLTAIERG